MHARSNISGRRFLSIRWLAIAAVVCRRWRAVACDAPQEHRSSLIFSRYSFSNTCRPNEVAFQGRRICLSAFARLARRLSFDELDALAHSLVASPFPLFVAAALAASGRPKSIREAIARAQHIHVDALSRLVALHVGDTHNGLGPHKGSSLATACCMLLAVAAAAGSAKAVALLAPLCGVDCVTRAAESAIRTRAGVTVLSALVGMLGGWDRPGIYPLLWYKAGSADNVAAARWLMARECDWARAETVFNRSEMLRAAVEHDGAHIVALYYECGIEIAAKRYVPLALASGSVRVCALLVARDTLMVSDPNSCINTMLSGRPRAPQRVSPQAAHWLINCEWFTPSSVTTVEALMRSGQPDEMRGNSSDAHVVARVIERWPTLAAAALKDAAVAARVWSTCAVARNAEALERIVLALRAVGFHASLDGYGAQHLDFWPVALAALDRKDDEWRLSDRELTAARDQNLAWLTHLARLAKPTPNTDSGDKQ